MSSQLTWRKTRDQAFGGGATGRDLSALSVLVVEDNLNTRRMVREILKAFGISNVVDARDGAVALTVMRSVPPDVIVCDINMTPLDGIGFVRMLRTSPDSPDAFVPVIMLTAYSSRHRVGAARDAGANEFIVKPFAPKTLYDHLISVIDSPRPYVRTDDFFGPDRRRHDTGPLAAGKERRGS